MKTRREYRNEARYRKEREIALYEAALRLIASGVNPAAMKVQQIADEAGIGKGTVYEYFASKEEILHGMALHCFDTEIARFAALLEPCTTCRGWRRQCLPICRIFPAAGWEPIR